MLISNTFEHGVPVQSQLLKSIQPVGVSKFGDTICLVCSSRSLGHKRLTVSTSIDGHAFKFNEDEPRLIMPGGKAVDPTKISDVRLSDIAQTSVLTFLSLATHELCIGIRHGLDEFGMWEVIPATNLPQGPGMIVPEYRHNGDFVLYASAQDGLRMAVSRDLRTWHANHQPLFGSRPDRFDVGPLKFISVTAIPQGLFVLYESSTIKGRQHKLTVGGAVFASDDPSRLLWRAETPLWSVDFRTRQKPVTLGAITRDNEILLFYRTAETKLITATFPQPFAIDPVSKSSTKLRRHPANPLMGPRDNHWESVGVFNPAVLDDGETIHILYRALNYSGMSYLGYASTKDGVTIDERSDTPAYWPREKWEGVDTAPYGFSDNFASGGGWGGCEDPKLTLIEDTVYLTYVAHDGYGPPRVAMSTMALGDFQAHNWDKWDPAKLISEPGIVNKSGVVLPEKINGKYVIFHRVFPNIQVHYADDFNLGEASGQWLESHGEITIRPHSWDSRKLSVGATPIRIKEGWLVIYHAVDDRDDQRYKIGAMILDADDPTKVLYRTNTPILVPETQYENEWKFGIAYPSGAAIKDGTLFVYYGGGDMFVCVATANLEEFVQDLMNEKPVHLGQAPALIN